MSAAAAHAVERPTRSQIERFLKESRFAAIGVSRNEKDFTRLLMREFQARGYEVVPVNPGAAEMEGRPCFGTIQHVSPAVSAVLLLTSSAASEQAVRDCADAGVKQIWMYRATGAGAVNAAAVEYCRERGIDVIAGECPLMFLPNAGFPHRVHGFVRKILGSYPR